MVRASTNDSASITHDSNRGMNHAVFERLRIPLIVLGIFTALCGIVYGAYNGCEKVNFLLDDYKHLDYAAKAFHGDLSGLARSFTANASGQTDGLTSFRPGIPLSVWLDYGVWGLNPVGYHLTNLLMFAACAFTVGIIAFQLTPYVAMKMRYLTGICAALLFVVYPIHAESVAWMIGRVDVHCTFFYLLSLSFYFSARMRESKELLAYSLFAFLLALAFKEMAFTLPVVIVVAELLLRQPLNWKQLAVRKRIATVGAFFAVLLAFVLVRYLVIGTMVGGYGVTSIKSFFKMLQNFLDVASFHKVLFGFNEEEQFPQAITTLAHNAWLVISVGLAARLCQSLERLRILLFPIAWMAISVLPTFQIWHIYPNLVGSRLFFLGSASLCVLLAVALVPGFQLPALRLQRAKAGKLPAIPGALRAWLHVLHFAALVALVVLATCWFQALQHNLYPWKEAGKQIVNFQTTIKKAVATAPEGTGILLLDLPQDFEGSGLVGRPELMAQILDKPIADADYSKKIVNLARPIPGPNEYIYTDLLGTVCGDETIKRTLKWDRQKGDYVDWARPQGDKTFPSTELSAKVENPQGTQTLWSSAAINLDPLAIGSIEVDSNGTLPAKDLAGKVRLVWRSQHQPKSWIDYSEGPFAEFQSETGKLAFTPSRYRSWALNGTITDLGVQFQPGTYSAEIKTMSGKSASQVSPGLSLTVNRKSGQKKVQDIVMPSLGTADSITVDYDASQIPGAQDVVILVTRADVACPDLPTKVVPPESQLLLQKPCANSKGSFQLPIDVLNQPGKHQVAVLALDGKGQSVGYLSEPRTYLIEALP